MSKQDDTKVRAINAQQNQLDREQYEADFKEFMGTAGGRRLMHVWLKRAGINERSYTGNSETFYREGRRGFGLELLQDVNTLCPRKYLTMLEEQLDD